MADRDTILDILNEAITKEKMAEDNCAKILEQLKKNGFYNEVEKIKNDEKRHQDIVKQLLEML
jgi:rubrerythrin